MSFIVFGTIAAAVNLVLNLIYAKTRLIGLDLLFFAPWLAVILYGIREAVILLILLFITKAIVQKGRINVTLLALPPQVVTIALGYLLGLGGFFITLLSYYAVSTGIVVLTKKLGARYFQFLLTNASVNIIAFFAYKSFYVDLL